MKLSSTQQLRLILFLLTVIGIGAAAYKHLFLGFPLLASEQEAVWQLEARVFFENQADATVDVRLNLPDNNPSNRIFGLDNISGTYDFGLFSESEVQYGRWQGVADGGPQILYLRALSHRPDELDVTQTQIIKAIQPNFSDLLTKPALSIINQPPLSDGVAGAVELLKRFNEPGDPRVELLLNGNASQEKRTRRAAQLLALAGYRVEPVAGVYLDDQIRTQSLSYFIELDISGERYLLDDREVARVPWRKVMLLQRDGEPLLEVYGGSDSRVIFAATKTLQAAFTTAVDVANREGNALVDFSIYSLPLSEQNAFKLLLMIPLGALVVVILRNLVGIRTSGTFMPVLIALTFLQTSLLTGLLLFLTVVSVGLVLRSYLSHLNLLLVPRIAAVLVFVIIIYAAIGILSTKLGWYEGLKVTFFPMIILSWTIERMSILWDEEGPREVVIESTGSLLTATLAYLLMSNGFIRDLIFLYPELLLVLLAIIIAIGSYAGYRLSDLRRFAPMERHDS